MVILFLAMSETVNHIKNAEFNDLAELNPLWLASLILCLRDCSQDIENVIASGCPMTITRIINGEVNIKNLKVID